ncbi:MAG: hypothetical protein RIQ33_8 [Bacteroidota bacterium]|jgi:hypothetical protein
MKINKLLSTAIVALVCNFAFAQSFFVPTTYRGAFAPSPAVAWTTGWTNFDPHNAIYPTATVTVNSNITSNTTWTTGNTYLLSGQIYVTSGATLTIQPGVKVLGDKSATGACLVITKGSKIHAVGTATAPIVFTSNQAKGNRATADWGGVVILGKATINQNGGTGGNGTANIEGFAASSLTEFGGGTSPDDNDNSGELQYVRIEFGGYVYAPNKEINGLTMGGVGRGTTIDHIQTSFTNDDAYEWFGGTVNCRYLVSYRDLDDCFDTDFGYSGNVQFGLALRDPSIADNPSVSVSEGFESDNDATGSTSTPKTKAIFSNITLIGPYRGNLSSTVASGYERGARIRRNSELKIFNTVFMDFKKGVHFSDAATESNYNNGLAKFSNNIIAGCITNIVNTNTTTINNLNAGNTFTSSTGTSILTAPYTTTTTGAYTGDYRPAASSIALSGASFSDASFSGLVLNTPAVGFDSMHICKLSTAPTLTATASAGCTIKWWGTYATGGVSTGTTAPTVSNVASKTYYVSQVNSLGVESARRGIKITIDPLVATPASITGRTIDLCTGVSYMYYVTTPAANATSYTWTMPVGATLVSTSTIGDTAWISYDNTYTVSVITVKANNYCGSSAPRVLKTKAKPGTPVAISGSSMVCSSVGSSTPLTYTIAGVSGFSNYTWSVPTGATLVSGQGTTSIDVTFQTGFLVGIIAVQTTGTCQSSLSRVFKTYVKPAALPTTLVSGNTTICSTGSTEVYTVNSVLGATSYNWVVPAGASILNGQGTDSVTVSFSSSVVNGSLIKVQAVNACGASAFKTATINVITCVARMASSNNVTQSQVKEYSTSLFPNPATNKFTVNYVSENASEIMISVYDVLGRKVSESKNLVSNGSNSIVVNCENFNAGVYTVKVINTTTNATETLQLVK